jgi:hypothetical protein
MLIREYHESDMEALRAIHTGQGFDYALPDLRNPLFVTKLVLTESPSPRQVCHSERRADEIGAKSRNLSSLRNDEVSGEILGAALLRLTAEAYLLLDPRAGTPRDRWQWLLALHEAARREAWQRGLEDVHAWLPPPIVKKFGRRLERLGWLRDDAWTPYCKRLTDRA